jgi:hypothetical protein
MIRRVILAAAALCLVASTASAGLFNDPAAAGFSPRVPISSLGLGMGGFDPSRLHVSSSFMVGSGFSGGSTNALNVTSLSYQFKMPLSMSVSVGNAFGPGAASGNSSFFLEGFNMRYQPSKNSVFQIQYKNVRSPLQYGYGYGDNADRAFWGY